MYGFLATPVELDGFEETIEPSAPNSGIVGRVFDFFAAGIWFVVAAGIVMVLFAAYEVISGRKGDGAQAAEALKSLRWVVGGIALAVFSGVIVYQTYVVISSAPSTTTTTSTTT